LACWILPPQNHKTWHPSRLPNLSSSPRRNIYLSIPTPLNIRTCHENML
jgi:hypothetical protein